MLKLFLNYFLKFCAVMTSFLLLAIPVVWLSLHYPTQLHLANTILAQYPLFFTLFRWILIICFVGFWPIFIKHYAKKKVWDAEKTRFWLHQRFHIAGWLVIFELLVCENLLLTLIKALWGLL